MTARPTISTNTHIGLETKTTVVETETGRPYVHIGETSFSTNGSSLFFHSNAHLIAWAESIIRQARK